MVLLFSKKTFAINIITTYLLFVVIYILENFYLNRFILIKSLYYSSLGEQLSNEKIDQIFNLKNNWNYVGYFLIPFVVFIKVLFTVVCLNCGYLFFEMKMSFKDTFRVALVAEVCLAMGSVVRIIWLTAMHIRSFTDVQSFSPFSLSQLLGSQSIPEYLLYFCQTINIFEIAYWLVLAGGLVVFLEKPFGTMFKLVMSSYGLGLLLWIVFVSYLTVTFSS